MSSYNRFIKNIGFYFLGNFATKILQFLFIPIYSFYLSPEEYGDFNYILSIIMLIVPLMFVDIWEGAFRFAIEKKDNEHAVLSTTSCFLIGMLIIYSLIYIIISKIYPIKYDVYILLLSIINTLTSYWQYAARALGLNKIYSLSTTSSALLNICLNIYLIVVLHWGIDALFIANIIGGLILVIIIESKARLLHHLTIKNWNWILLKEILIYSLPLAINAMSWWLYTSLNNLIITNYLGSMANGIYSMAMRFGTMLSLFTFVINMAWLEESFRIADEEGKDEKFLSVLTQLSNFLFAAFIILIPVGAIIYKYFVFNEYKAGLILLPLIFLSAVFTTLTNHLGSAFLANKDSRSMFWTTLFGGIVSLVFSLVLIRYLGLFGSVLGSALGFISVYYLRIFLLNKMGWFKLKIHNSGILLTFIFLIPLNAIITRYDNIWILIGLTICMTVIGLYKNIGLLNRITSKIRHNEK